MSYTKQTWDTTSYVNPTRMNHIEDGIKENSDNINSPAFTEAATRANINSGESLFTILGKIKKFFTDLKTVAFSGLASDVVMSDGETSVENAVSELTYKSGDTVSIVRNVFPAWGGGNRKELAFWIPLDKTYGNLTPSLTGTVDIFEGDGTTAIAVTKDITDFSITYTYTNAYLYVNLRHSTNLFSAAGVKFILATALTLTFT